MSSWDELNKLSRKKDHSKEIFEINKRLKSITRVIQNPDEFNVNISSRDKLVELEERINKLEQSIQELIELTSLNEDK
mgnify:CR=1 FL=1